jgi:hypothetical protein
MILLPAVDICPRCRSLACKGDVLLECRGRLAHELELRRRDRVGRPTPNQWNQQNGRVA